MLCLCCPEGTPPDLWHTRGASAGLQEEVILGMSPNFGFNQIAEVGIGVNASCLGAVNIFARKLREKKKDAGLEKCHWPAWGGHRPRSEHVPLQ